MPQMIDQFRGTFYFLSNFYDAPVEYGGILYNNNEAAFQAQKEPARAKEFTTLPPNEAKRLGRRVTLCPDWESVKLDIMEGIVYAKFTQNPNLKARLLATGDAVLIEGNYWHDNFYGDCSCNRCTNKPGKNMLGKILMNLRGELNSAE